jgi:hypothetical protein
MGGQAKRFQVAPWRHPIHPRSRYRYCIGISNPGRRGSSQFYERVLKIDREIRNLISTIATCWSGGRGNQTGTSALGGSNEPASQLGDLKREGKGPEGDPAVPYCMVLCCMILSHKRARNCNRFMRCETAHVDLILCF